MAFLAHTSKPSQPAKLRMRQKRLTARLASMGVVLTKVIICGARQSVQVRVKMLLKVR